MSMSVSNVSNGFTFPLSIAVSTPRISKWILSEAFWLLSFL